MGELGVEHGVVVPVGVGGEGGPSRRAARGSQWRRSSRGLYVPAWVDPTPEQRVVEAGVMVAPPGAVTGWAASRWFGSTWSSGLWGDGVTPRPVPIAQPRRLIRPQPHLHLCEERFDHREVEVVDGLRVTTRVRSVCFDLRYAPHLEEAVRRLDMACFDDLVSIAQVREWAQRHPSYTGIDQCRRAPDLADENAWSPTEVTMRLDWTLVAGRRPLTNRPVFDLDGHHIGTPDLIDPEAGVVGQYDGRLHLAGERRAADLRRDQRFAEHGLQTVVMVAADLPDPSAYHRRLRSAYAEAARRPSTDRTFTLALPAWWRPTFTVEQRRALSAEDRRRWLGRGRSEAG